MFKKLIMLASVFCVVILMVNIGWGMKVCLFPAVNGSVILNGTPVNGAVLKRSAKWTWGEETVEDSAITSADGKFQFSPIFKRMYLGAILPHEPNVELTLLIEHNGVTYKALLARKSDYDDPGIIEIVCELSNPIEHSSVGFGICRPIK
jgi:hypothetical protein